MNLADDFKREVVDDFVSEYASSHAEPVRNGHVTRAGDARLESKSVRADELADGVDRHNAAPGRPEDLPGARARRPRARAAGPAPHPAEASGPPPAASGPAAAVRPGARRKRGAARDAVAKTSHSSGPLGSGSGFASLAPLGRIAQRESARFTRERSLVRSQVRPFRPPWPSRLGSTMRVMRVGDDRKCAPPWRYRWRYAASHFAAAAKTTHNTDLPDLHAGHPRSSSSRSATHSARTVRPQ